MKSYVGVRLWDIWSVLSYVHSWMKNIINLIGQLIKIRFVKPYKCIICVSKNLNGYPTHIRLQYRQLKGIVRTKKDRYVKLKLFLFSIWYLLIIGTVVARLVNGFSISLKSLGLLGIIWDVKFKRVFAIEATKLSG